MTVARPHRVAAAASGLLLCGCGSAATDVSGASVLPLSAPVTASTTGTNTEVSTVTIPANIEPGMQGLVDQAVADLAKRLNVDAASIATVSASAMVWPDGSVGCPQPGMLYTQVTVDGALIVLSAGGATYRYHSGGPRSPFLCTKA